MPLTPAHDPFADVLGARRGDARFSQMQAAPDSRGSVELVGELADRLRDPRFSAAAVDDAVRLAAAFTDRTAPLRLQLIGMLADHITARYVPSLCGDFHDLLDVLYLPGPRASRLVRNTDTICVLVPGTRKRGLRGKQQRRAVCGALRERERPRFRQAPVGAWADPRRLVRCRACEGGVAEADLDGTARAELRQTRALDPQVRAAARDRVYESLLASVSKNVRDVAITTQPVFHQALMDSALNLAAGHPDRVAEALRDKHIFYDRRRVIDAEAARQAVGMLWRRPWDIQNVAKRLLGVYD